MALSLKSSCFLQLKKPEVGFIVCFSSKKALISVKRYTPVAAMRTMKAPGLSETFTRLKKEGKVAFIPYITAGDPDLSTTAEALKVLDSCGSDIIELGVPYSDPLADGPVIQAAATRSLAKGTNFNSIISMLKEGFTKEIHLKKDRWQGYIKDYDGGILMECKIDPKLPYTDLSTMIRRQRQAIDEKIRELSNCHIVYAGIDFQKKEAGIPKKIIDDIPGLREAGWTPDQWGHSRFRSLNVSTDNTTNQKHLSGFMRSLLKSMHEHADAWPFKEPVDARDVPDYYDIIKDPMDLKTMSKRVESELYYVTFEMFVADVRRMFANARTYNSPETIYYKCATRLESHFQSKVQAGLQSGSKIQ